MTTPQYTVIGTPFSTFTRTITLALHYKGIPFHHVRVVAHSDVANEHHPFGFIPALVVHEINGKAVDLKLRESMAIAQYIERVAPQPSLLIAPGDGPAIIVEQMWEFVSFVGAYGFPTIEKSVVKPHLAAVDAGRPDAETREKIQSSVEGLRHFLASIEAHMSLDGYVFGEKLSWADFFLFPLLADLNAIPERELISERLMKWIELMRELDAVKATTPGTLSVNARPP